MGASAHTYTHTLTLTVGPGIDNSGLLGSSSAENSMLQIELIQDSSLLQDRKTSSGEENSTVRKPLGILGFYTGKPVIRRVFSLHVAFETS